MPHQTRVVTPGPDNRSARTIQGQILCAPADWTLVPPGDPGLTRRLKAAGPTWTVQEKVGRRTFSRGVWGSRASVELIRAALAAERATPVGSGTVARTERIPVEQRAEAAVIAWMRHQTTAYDHMAIARIKGKRREVRRMLAQQSKSLLENYRAGREVIATGCPLQRALSKGVARSA